MLMRDAAGSNYLNNYIHIRKGKTRTRPLACYRTAGAAGSAIASQRSSRTSGLTNFLWLRNTIARERGIAAYRAWLPLERIRPADCPQESSLGVYGDNNDTATIRLSSLVSIWSFELASGSGTNSSW